MIRPLLVVVATLSLAGCKCEGPGPSGDKAKASAPKAKKEKAPPKKHPLVPDVTSKSHGGGYGWVGGLAAMPDGSVWFGDTRKLEVHKLDPAGVASKVFGDSGAAAGLAFDAQGRLYAAEEHTRRVTRRAAGGKGEPEILAEAWEGERLNGPKGVAVDAKGGVYFTDPHFPRKGKGEMTLDSEALFYLPADGALKRLDDDLGRPTGIALSKDGKLLYVADHGEELLYRYGIKPDGTTTKRTEFLDNVPRIDGVTLDAQGNVWISAAGGVHTFDSKGNRLGGIKIKRKPSSLVFGGADGKTLYVTLGTGGVRSYRTTVAGAGHKATTPAKAETPAKAAAPAAPAQAPAATAVKPASPAGAQAKSDTK